MPTNTAKIELSFEPELNFCNFGGSKMSLQEHSERQGDSNIFPKMRQDITTKIKKVQSFKVFARAVTNTQIK